VIGVVASPRCRKLIRGAGGKQESRNINYYRMIEEVVKIDAAGTREPVVVLRRSGTGGRG